MSNFFFFGLAMVVLEKFGLMEQREPMHQTSHITSQIGSIWWRSCKVLSTYFPTPARTLGGSEMRKDSPGAHAGLPSIGLHYQLEMQALKSKYTIQAKQTITFCSFSSLHYTIESLRASQSRLVGFSTSLLL